MRHTASCIFTHVDPDVVTNFGFLPQDMLGKSVFDFYHPEDMPFLKEVYESGMFRNCVLYKKYYLTYICLFSNANVPHYWISISK